MPQKLKNRKQNATTTTAFNNEVSYTQLFPDTPFNNVGDAYSVLGQGAYFISLMNLAADDRFISPKEGDLSLKTRRPDLWELQVKQAAAEEETPYLERVQNLMCRHIDKGDASAVWEEIAAGENSFVPFNRALNRIQAFLSVYNTSFEALAPAFGKNDYESTEWFMAELGLSQSDLEILKRPAKHLEQWPSAEKMTPTQFQVATGLNQEEMLLLIYNKLPEDKDLGALFINRDNAASPLKYVAYDGNNEAHFINLTAARLQRIRQFLALANSTGWDFVTLNAVLSSGTIWEEGPETTEGNLTRMAKLSYISRQLSVRPVNLVPVEASGGQRQSSPGISQTLATLGHTPLSPLMDALKLSNQLARQEHKKGSSPDQQQINLLLPLAAKMGITLANLQLHRQINNIEDFTVEALFELVQLHNTLTACGTSLLDYINLETSVYCYDQLDKNVDEWLAHLQEQLDQTEKTNTPANATGDNNPNLKKTDKKQKLKTESEQAQLQMLLFQQWTHELAVYWGQKDAGVYNLMLGFSYALSSEADNSKGILALNNLIRGIDGKNGPGIHEFLKSLYPYIGLLNSLPMDSAAMQFAGRRLLPVENFAAGTFGIKEAHCILQFNTVYNQLEQNKQQAYLQFLSKKSLTAADLAKHLPEFMLWPEDDILVLLNSWITTGRGKKAATFNLEQGIYFIEKLSRCFKAAMSSTLSSAELSALLRLLHKENWKEQEESARNLTAKIRSLQSPAALQQYKGAEGRCLEKERDRLVPVLLWKINLRYSDINSPGHLSDYLLCDVKMSGAMHITPLREATDAVQTYLMRCKTGLEKIDLEKLKNITPEQWQWVPSFELWQAEQQLKTYPQNYLQADVRSTATPQFKELVEALNQNELTPGQAETGLLNYLDAWVDLENANIVDASCYITYSALYKKEVETFFLVSKSVTEENTFYFTRKECDTNGQFTWYPWQKIEASIQAETVSAAFAFNRLNIFWSELSTVSDTDPTVPNGKYTLHTATIKGIYQNLDGSWTSPKTISETPFYIDLLPKSTLFKWGNVKSDEAISEKIKELFNPSNPYWKKVGVQVVKETKTEGVFLQLFSGPWWDFSNGTVAKESFEIKNAASIDDSKLLGFRNFINTNYNRVSPFNGQQAPKKSSIFLFAPVLLNDLLQDIPVYLGNDAYVFEYLSAKVFLPPINPALYLVEKNKKVSAVDYGNVILDNYKSILGLDYGYNSGQLFISPDATVLSFFAVRNRIGAFYVKFKNAGYLLYTPLPLKALKPLTINTEEINVNRKYISINYDVDFKLTDLKFRTDRMYTPSVNKLLSEAHSCGQEFLARDNQSEELGSPLSKFSNLIPLEHHIIGPNEDSDNKIEFSGPFGIYARELFFHAPMAIGQLLSNSLQFDAARNWYHKVYNSLGVSEKNTKGVWQYLPFYEFEAPGVKNVNLNNPDLIAENDISVYMQWSLEQYILFVLNFADNQFMKETWESLSAATQLYFEAEDLLGNEPQIKDLTAALEKEDRNYDKIKDIERSFKIPSNASLLALWARVKDRLYKLRNGLNINGDRQMPALYGATVDPARLILALKNGGINPYDPASVAKTSTVYRFRELLPHTESIINMVAEFGGQLYNALQQKDSEQLQVLQATHQVNLLNALTQVYQYQVDEASKEIQVLKNSLLAVQSQFNYYSSLVSQGDLAQETNSLRLNESAAAFQYSGSVTNMLAVKANLMPTIFGFANGGMHFGGAISSVAASFNDMAMGLQTTAQVLATQAEYIRRMEEWQFQQEQALLSAEQINSSLEAAQVRLSIALENKKQFRLQVSQANEILNYLTGKFSNIELYTWMSNKMSSLYFTAYQLAITGLNKLQTAYAYELDDDSNFIPANAWDSVKKGLLAGETLKLALARMRDAYLNKNVRRQQIEKLISLKELVGEVKWKGLHDEGVLPFGLSKSKVNAPAGIVKLHSVAVSIPAVIGPYQTFGATLTCNATGEQITVSKGIDDMGVFAEEINDGRYLPFEGLRLEEQEQDWEFSLDKQLSGKISDIILTVKFTVKK